MRILIVDDEANIREVVREYSELSGYETDEAQDGVEAVEKVKQTHYDCVILDVMMPALDGFSACLNILAKNEKLRHEMGEYNLKVIKDYDVEVVKREIQSIYKDVLC